MKPGRNAGQGTVEYALILALVAIAIIVGLLLTGTSISSVYCRVVSALGAGSCSASLCQDGFNDLSGSQGLTGTWTASDGQVCNRNGGVLYNKCSMSNFTATDYSATLSGARLTAGNGYGIYFRATNTGKGVNGYAFQYDPGAKGFVIRKWVNGVEVFTPTLAQVTIPNFDWYSTPHTLSVEALVGYVDGKVVLTAHDSTYTSGGTGIRTWDSTALCVDDFSINSP
jgi:Flp pilus assembly pilin Flp